MFRKSLKFPCRSRAKVGLGGKVVLLPHCIAYIVPPTQYTICVRSWNETLCFLYLLVKPDEQSIFRKRKKLNKHGPGFVKRMQWVIFTPLSQKFMHSVLWIYKNIVHMVKIIFLPSFLPSILPSLLPSSLPSIKLVRRGTTLRVFCNVFLISMFNSLRHRYLFVLL